MLCTSPDLVDALFEAARYDEADSLAAILADNPSIDLCSILDENSNTLFHYCAANGSVQFFEILKIRASLDSYDRPNSSGNTPLHWATLNKQKELVRQLLELGCNPMTKNSFGQTPTDEAERVLDDEITSLYSARIQTENQE